MRGAVLYTKREKLPDAHHPSDSVSESISPYELVACGPISRPNISAALLIENISRYIYMCVCVCMCVSISAFVHASGARRVHEGEPPWRWRENSHPEFVFAAAVAAASSPL